MSETEKKPTYMEIAEKTGISSATISRVVTGASNVKEETRRRVLFALEEHGFNTADIIERERARGERFGRPVIFNIPTMANPFYSQIIFGAKSAAVRHGYRLLINEEHINGNTIDSIINLVQSVNAAGLILTNFAETAYLKKLSSVIPLVQCCEYDATLNIPYVSIDDIAAAHTVMDYLFSLGRRRIAFINGPIRYKYARHRLQGYTEALEEAGIGMKADLIIQLPEINYDMAVSAVTQLLNTHQADDAPDAIFCVSDVFAAASIKAASRLGFSVPGGLVITGFDNIEIAGMISPSITTIDQPRFQIGFSGTEILAERIANPSAPARGILLETSLIVRESTRRQG
ncbi:MAG: LacI family DNA-binding transcriptional regulator [Spirochaetaceae bacterium]|jgi:LacI family repressor for deo operon, udp, cdd, tsx, nupC, and nupG|nr:LacI family DNA-binding transcriptional regulator [Spirochaetaceae bacterium]